MSLFDVSKWNAVGVLTTSLYLGLAMFVFACVASMIKINRSRAKLRTTLDKKIADLTQSVNQAKTELDAKKADLDKETAGTPMYKQLYKEWNSLDSKHLGLVANKEHAEKRKKQAEWAFADWFRARLSGLNWDFTKNWASSFVLLGGILAVIARTIALPEEPKVVTSTGFVTLSTLFPVLVVVAPFVVAALNSLGSEMRKDDGTLILDGNKNVPLLIAPYIAGTAVVFWAVTGQLATLAILFEEMQVAEGWDPGVFGAAQIALLVLWLVGVWYVGERAVDTSMGATPNRAIKRAANATTDAYQLEAEGERPVFLP